MTITIPLMRSCIWNPQKFLSLSAVACRSLLVSNPTFLSFNSKSVMFISISISSLNTYSSPGHACLDTLGFLSIFSKDQSSQTTVVGPDSWKSWLISLLYLPPPSSCKYFKTFSQAGSCTNRVGSIVSPWWGAGCALPSVAAEGWGLWMQVWLRQPKNSEQGGAVPAIRSVTSWKSCTPPHTHTTYQCLKQV